jgi:hypothetical protein
LFRSMYASLSIPVLLQDRFAATLLGLCEEANAHGVRDRLMAPLLGLLCRRLYGVMARVTRTLARLQAGRAPMRRRRAVRPDGSTHPHTRPLPEREGKTETVQLRYGWAWMIRIAPRVAEYAPQMQALLDEPEMQAALAASPSLRRALRPLCRGLAFPAPPVMAEARRSRRSRSGTVGRAGGDPAGSGAALGTRGEAEAGATSGVGMGAEASPPVRPVVAWPATWPGGAPFGSVGLSVAISNHNPIPHHHSRPGGRDSPGIAPAVLRVFTR